MSNPTNPADAMVSVAQAARLLHTTRAIVQTWAENIHFGAVEIDGKHYFPSDRFDLLTVEDVARMLQVNVQTVRRWAREGAYPAIRVGRRFYFSRKIFQAPAIPEPA